MVGKSYTTLAGGIRLRVVNFRLSLPPSSGQFSVITTIYKAGDINISIPVPNLIQALYNLERRFRMC